MFIYKTTNLINGKIYIGMYSGKNPNYLGSGVYLRHAIDKYGKDNFVREILEDGIDDRKALAEKERFWINFYQSNNSNIGYNLTAGGEGIFNPSEETRKKISEGNKGKVRSEEEKRILSEYRKGMKHTPEELRKMSESQKGKSKSKEQVQKRKQTIDNWTDEKRENVRMKISNAAKNFRKKLVDLPNVTLVAIDCTDRINDTIEAFRKSSQNIKFGEVILLSNKRPLNLPRFIQYKNITNIKNINEYNLFVFMNLGYYIQTPYCLTIQDHAHVLSASAWTNEFLEFSYIGAPWPVIPNTYIANNGEIARVGNGGFSLRSKQLLDLPKKMGWNLREEQGWANEDGNICCYWRKEMLENGIRYAPVEIAARFAYENTVPENIGITPFGYHRNLPPW